MAQHQVELSDRNMILYLLNFIRYDIPILMAGKSSIGKSFTILALAKQWGIPNSVLYVGSEKADNIEGLPKLIQTAQSEQTSESVLEYFKPYWYPKSQLIQNAVQSGQDIFDTRVMPYLKESSGLLPYNTVMGLLWAISNLSFKGDKTEQTFNFVDTTNYIDANSNGNNELLTQGVTLKRELLEKGEEMLSKKNELFELSLYLCTLVGLGNYWLVLDELDKVQPEEADKFAPMLHIVRERRLKTYSMRELNDGKGADVAMNVKNDSYLSIYDIIKESLANGQSVLDTRIIGISNQTKNIEDISDALFKRFVQVVINKIIKLKPVEKRLEVIKSCLDKIETKIGVEQGDLAVAYLQEINLQWTFGFLPRLLNEGDTEGNFIKKNFEAEISDVIMNTKDAEELKEKINSVRINTALYKLCVDNFDVEVPLAKTDEDDDNDKDKTIPDFVMDCLQGQIVNIAKLGEVEATSNAIDLVNDLKKKFDRDDDVAYEVYRILWDRYQNIPKNESQRLEMEKLIDYAFSFITQTAYADVKNDKDVSQKINDKVAYSPLEVNKYLIPLIIKFTLKSITKDSKMGFDDKDALLSRHAELWDKFAIPDHIDKIKGDPDLTNKLFYGGEDSLWGSSDLNADDFQKSFVNSYNSANAQLFEEFIMAYIAMDTDKRDEFKDFIDYIKKYRSNEVVTIREKEVLALLKAKKVVEGNQLRAKFNTLFGL
ncbi:MAG: hypothetical protein IPJ01_11750 [Micavibrio sp.]|nr:hypothetical protein [Micavibrio sp.]